MGLQPKPQSWDDVQPGDVIAWTEPKWSHKLHRLTERPRRMVVRWVADYRSPHHESVRSVWGVLVTKADQPHKSMNTYPLTDANHVSTGEMGTVVGLSLEWITSLDRPSYVEEPDAAHTAPPPRLADLSGRQQEAINGYSRLGGFGIDYLARTGTSAALVGKGLLSPIFRVNGFGRQWLTRDGFKVAGIDLATVIAEARDAALIEHIERGHNPADIVHDMSELPELDAQSSAYARDVEFTDPPRFPAGTPEYEAYATELHGELEKFAKGNESYGYDPAPRTLRELITELVAASHSQYAGLPPQTGWTNARRAEQAARATELLGEIEHRIELVREQAGNDDGTITMILEILNGRTS